MIAAAPAPARETGPFDDFESRLLQRFQAAVEEWDGACSILGPWEARHLAQQPSQPSEATSARHQQFVKELLSWGEMVGAATGHPDFPDRSLASRVQARLVHLRDKLALWHGEMSEPEAERILAAAFP